MRSLRTVLLMASLCVTPPLVHAQSAPTAPSDTSGGTLKPGDVVRLKIWREPDLSGDFVVDEHGGVVVPKLGRVPVVGLSPEVITCLTLSPSAPSSAFSLPAIRRSPEVRANAIS